MCLVICLKWLRLSTGCHIKSKAGKRKLVSLTLINLWVWKTCHMQFPLQKSPRIHKKYEGPERVRHAESYSYQKHWIISSAFPAIPAFHSSEGYSQSHLTRPRQNHQLQNTTRYQDNVFRSPSPYFTPVKLKTLNKPALSQYKSSFSIKQRYSSAF